MANDDPNSSNNSSAPNGVSDFGMSRLDEIGRSTYRSPAEERDLRRRAKGANRAEEAFNQLDAHHRSLPLFQKIHKNAMNTLNSTEPRIRIGVESRLERGAQQAMNMVGREFSEGRINSMVNSLGDSPEVQLAASGMMNTPYNQLMERRNAMMSSVTAIREQNVSLAGTVMGRRGMRGDVQGEMAANAQKAQELVRQMAPINVAMNQQRNLGLDPSSQMESLLGAGQKAQGVLYRSGVGKELAGSGGDLGGKNMDQLRQREVQLSQQLVEALEKLKNAAGSSSEEVDKLKTAAQGTAEDLKKTEEAMRQVGEGGGGNRYGGAANIANLAGSAFGAAGSAIQQIAVSQRLAQTQNVSGYAAIENQKYQTYKSAAGGDVASQLMMSQFGAAEQFGRQLRTGANIAVGAQAAGGVAQIAAGGARIASTSNPISDIVNTSGAAGAAIQGAQDIMQGAATTAVAGADLGRDVSGSSAAIAGVNAQLEARRQIQAVSAEQLQGFRDFSVGVGSAAIGMGGKGAAFVQRMVTKENLSQMTNSRISPEQMAQMSQMGVQQIGSTFNESQIFGARGLERSGFGTIGENMTRMSTLAAAGSNNPQAGLGSVLEAAFSKGLEGSKVLNMMVENTATMAQASTGRAMGIDTTGAAAQILAAGVNTADPNQEYATQRAMSVQEQMKSIGTDTGVNFAAMAATSRISKMTGMSGTEAIIAQQFDDSTLRSMKNMAPNEIKSKLFDRGINIKEGKEVETVNQLIKARLITNIQSGGAGLATGVDADKIAEKMTKGTALTQDEQLAYNRAQGISGRGGAETMRAATAIVSDTPNQIAVGKAAGAMKGEGGSDQQKMLDDMRTQGFKQLSQAALEATKDFKTAADALKALGALSKSVEGIGDAGGEGKFKTAASDSAKTFGEGANKFKNSVDDFTKAVGILSNKAGLSSDDTSTNDLIKGLTGNTAKRGTGP